MYDLLCLNVIKKITNLYKKTFLLVKVYLTYVQYFPKIKRKFYHQIRVYFFKVSNVSNVSISLDNVMTLY